MSCVTAVEGEWLAELGSMFFSVKETYESTLRKRQERKQKECKMEEEMALKQRAQVAGKTVENLTLKTNKSKKGSQIVATSHDSSRSTPRFMPRKRGRLGL